MEGPADPPAVATAAAVSYSSIYLRVMQVDSSRILDHYGLRIIRTLYAMCAERSGGGQSLYEVEHSGNKYSRNIYAAVTHGSSLTRSCCERSGLREAGSSPWSYYDMYAAAVVSCPPPCLPQSVHGALVRR